MFYQIKNPAGANLYLSGLFCVNLVVCHQTKELMLESFWNCVYFFQSVLHQSCNSSEPNCSHGWKPFGKQLHCAIIGTVVYMVDLDCYLQSGFIVFFIISFVILSGSFWTPLTCTKLSGYMHLFVLVSFYTFFVLAMCARLS